MYDICMGFNFNEENVIFQIGIGNDVIVMEYCLGGSLYLMLDKFKYVFGFLEEEFFIVLYDISNY